MTVSELEEMLSQIEDKEMNVLLNIGTSDDEILVSVCKEKSEVISMPIVESEDDLYDEYGEEIPEEEFEQHSVLLLLPCDCYEDLEIGEINSQPELN